MLSAQASAHKILNEPPFFYHKFVFHLHRKYWWGSFVVIMTASVALVADMYIRFCSDAYHCSEQAVGPIVNSVNFSDPLFYFMALLYSQNAIIIRAFFIKFPFFNLFAIFYFITKSSQFLRTLLRSRKKVINTFIDGKCQKSKTNVVLVCLLMHS